MWLRLWKHGKQFFNVPDIQVLHRIHRESAFNAKGHTLAVKQLILQYNKNII